jgi:hypothetical protein
VRYFAPHRLIDVFVRLTHTKKETLRERFFGHAPKARTLINTAASIGKYGLTRPQRFAAPIIVVWNITQACNLACSHCYQNARSRLLDELSPEEQLSVVGQPADSYVSIHRSLQNCLHSGLWSFYISPKPGRPTV